MEGLAEQAFSFADLAAADPHLGKLKGDVSAAGVAGRAEGQGAVKQVARACQVTAAQGPCAGGREPGRAAARQLGPAAAERAEVRKVGAGPFQVGAAEPGIA